MTRSFGWKPAIIVCAVVALGLASPAGATTFTFDYKISNAAPHNLVAPGSYGTITLTDSLIDPYRVDVSLTATPATGTYIEMFFLNFVGSLPALPKWYFVPQSNAAGDTTPSAGGWSVNFDAKEVLNTGFMFDFLSIPNGKSLSFTGSIALFNHDTLLSSRFDLSVSDFIGTSVGGTAPLYAAYTANDAGGNQGYGATGPTPGTFGPTAVPEPASLLLFGTGLLGARGLVRRRRNGK